MKTALHALALATALIVTSQAIAAQEVVGTHAPAKPGAPTWHHYNCTAPSIAGRPVLGVDYQLQVSTAALPPQYYVEDARVLRKPVTPHGQWSAITFDQKNEDISSAVFSSSKNKIDVRVAKPSLSALVELGGGVTMTCTVK